MTVNSMGSTPDVLGPVDNRQKTPWKMGDPSSFQELFSGSLAAAPTQLPPATLAAAPAVAPVAAPVAAPVVAAPVAAAAAPVTSAVTSPAAAPLPKYTFEQGATVTNPDGTTAPMNPMELATTETANLMAAKLGGTVTGNSFTGGFTTSASIREIIFANSNVQVNAGLAASLFSMYGDAQGSQAWQIINRDLGRDPMATGPVS